MPHSSQVLLEQAGRHAQAGRFAEMLGICQQIASDDPDDVNVLLDVGALLLNTGFLERARQCFERVCSLTPNDLRPRVNLANLCREAGDHTESQRQYAALRIAQPNHPVIRRNALLSQEYDPVASEAERLEHVRKWGNWAIVQAGGWRPRPLLKGLAARPLRVGYVSADLCQHTVGLFLTRILEAHDPEKVAVFAYSAGIVHDWVTTTIRQVTTFRDVASANDTTLADWIRRDDIDVLIDLSGHTAGSRLTVFAHRPAPVMVSWLGYFASTGLSYIDAVLLDEWHAPAGSEAQFVEPIIRLSSGRFCYQPVPWVPAEVSSLPRLRNGYVTFGCFNNTAKLNDLVFDVWARLLAAVPKSRLVLKWRTLVDEALCDSIRSIFDRQGIEPQRLELRPASFHVDVLKEYGDIDIALDPFPFPGGLTSCEALYMGVPVVTWPQSRVVSRQTFALLSAIGLQDLAARDADDYVRIAAGLANNQERLAELRVTLRERMCASPLMDVTGFTRALEDTLIELYRKIQVDEKTLAMNRKTILHVGPGHRNNGARLPAAFQGIEWKEIRLDIDPANEPDIVGSMLDMSAVGNASVDAIYSSHNIEHVYAHEVHVVLGEFLRVLKSDGFAVITCPDLQTVCALVAENKLTDAAYHSAAGAITPLDILYGHGQALAQGHYYMAHKCGFTEKSLTAALLNAGFKTVAGKRRSKGLDLWMVANKGAMPEAEMLELAGRVLPA